MLINKRIYDHTRSLKRGNIKNVLVRYNLETNHNFNFKDSKMLLQIRKKKRRKIVATSIISNYNTIKQDCFFFNSFLIWSDRC